jgi:excisionase family DNA binding protein
MSTPDNRWLLQTLRDSAAQLAVSKSTIRRLIRAGTLAAVRVGGRRLIDSRDLEAFVAAAKQRGMRPGAPTTPEQMSKESSTPK